LFYTDDISILGGHLKSIKGNTETFLVGGKEIGVEVNADTTTYMVMVRNWNAGRGHSVNFNNSHFEGVK
jgi:hypothetical protein